jgi:uncharacterized membrane protein YjjP (DUF1212 family)
MKLTSSQFIGALAVLLVFAFFASILILCFHEVPKDNQQMINIFLGLLGSFASSAVGYYYGTTKGSSDKNAIIANSTPIAPPETPVTDPNEVTNQNK